MFGRLLAIPTRWLVASMVISIAALGSLAYWDGQRRSQEALDELGEHCVAVAEASVLALGGDRDPAVVLRALDRADQRVLLVGGDGRPRGIDGHAYDVPGLADALAGGERTARVARDVATSLQLPERTAMLGVARRPDGGAVVIVTTAERQRDRDRASATRMLVAMGLATGLVGAFGGLALARQRAQLVLARELAVTEAARARDAELERLSRAATMAAIGSGVAHELSTPLGVISGRAEQVLARAKADGDERTAKAAAAIVEQVENVDRVVRGLLGLARGAPIALQPTPPTVLVRDAAALVEHRFARADVRLATAVADGLPAVRCEPLLFKHALVNLLLNACDASPPGATVRLDVREAAGEVAFVVTDDGQGIAPADAARALEPFFTTKPVGKGTGLGLAIAREIASTHRGSLSIAPRETHGTRAAITVPIEAAS